MIEITRDERMRGFLIRGDESVAFVKKRTWRGVKLIRVKSIIICDKVFMKTDLFLRRLDK